MSPHIVSIDSFAKSACNIWVDDKPCVPAHDVGCLLAACACVPRTMSWAIHARPMHHQYLQQEVFQMREQSSCKVISYLRKTARQWLTQCSSWWWCIAFVVSLTPTVSAKTTLMFAFDRVLPKAVKRLFFSIALITTIIFLNRTLTY